MREQGDVEGYKSENGEEQFAKTTKVDFSTDMVKEMVSGDDESNSITADVIPAAINSMKTEFSLTIDGVRIKT